MLKDFFELFRRESLLRQAFERSMEMLASDQTMFEEAVRSLRQRDDARLEVDIYAMDQAINDYQREVRRKVFTHLTVSDGDLKAALVLVSIIIDIERIGDYTKNIVEIALQHPKRLHCGLFEEQLAHIEQTVIKMLGMLREALPATDRDGARKVMSEHWWIARACEEINHALIVHDEPTLPCREAVTTVLYSRYLKRISAHLMNIASSVVNPFDRIGFREEEMEAEED